MNRSRLRFTRRTWVLVAALGLVAVTGIFLHRQISGAFAVQLLLHSKNPSQEFFEAVAGQYQNVDSFLRACWATGRVRHRGLVAEFLKERAIGKRPWPQLCQELALAGARDADMSVRELALAALDARHDPELLECAREQLRDVDPQVRLLGLDYLRKSDASKGVPIVMGLLDDPDLRVVASAEVALMRWSGQDFGVRTMLAIPPQTGENPNQIDPSNEAIIRKGVERRKAWWQLHRVDYPVAGWRGIKVRRDEPARPPAPNFALKDLDDRGVRLSDFRGQVVLLNFWATWCTACQAELPDLIALQKEKKGRFVILGVALDSVSQDEGAERGREGLTLDQVRQKVLRTVKARGINYTVLLDPENSVGGQFNGGELPTNVLIDPQGRVQRRFIGARDKRVLDAMVAEAGQGE